MSLDFTSTIQTPLAVGPEALVSEANHRIANNLSVITGLVRMHVSSVAKMTGSMPIGEVQQMLEEVAVRIEAVGRLHRYLAHQGGSANIDLASYLHDISNSVFSSLSFAGRGNLTFHSPAECIVPGREALTIGFIVSELLTNAVKYAHPSSVLGNFRVSCSQAGAFVTVEVVDDGVGLPDNFDPATDGDLGLRLVRLLANQLRADLSFENTGLGLRVRLRAKLGASAETKTADAGAMANLKDRRRQNGRVVDAV